MKFGVSGKIGKINDLRIFGWFRISLGDFLNAFDLLLIFVFFLFLMSKKSSVVPQQDQILMTGTKWTQSYAYVLLDSYNLYKTYMQLRQNKYTHVNNT